MADGKGDAKVASMVERKAVSVVALSVGSLDSLMAVYWEFSKAAGMVVWLEPY